MCVFREIAGPNRASVDLSGLLVIHPILPGSSCVTSFLQRRLFKSSFICTMAPQKHVAEVPRSILPRLTWNSSTSRPTVSSYKPVLATRQRQQQYTLGWSPLSRQIHSLDTQIQTSRGFSTSTQSPHCASLVPRRPQASTTPSSEPLGNPIRHNGVYVATFKPAQRAFHATPVRPREHHFDTLKFVKRLQAEGFSEEQAVAMMRVLNDIIQESIQNLTRTMVLREGEHVADST
jgi:hypothetical protein